VPLELELELLLDVFELELLLLEPVELLLLELPPVCSSKLKSWLA
jgi:hypothetical protein